MKDGKYTSSGGRDTKIRNTQGQVEWMKDKKYSRLDGRDGRLEILQVRGASMQRSGITHI